MKSFVLAAGLTLAALPSVAFDMSSMSDTERTQFRAEIRSYLLENPEVLMEAIGVLEQRQAEQQVHGDVSLVRANADALFNDGYSFVAGNPDGDITIVEFTDYRCGYCRKAHPEVKELLESDGNIRLIVKEFPILGEQSVLASKFAMATLQVAGPEAYGMVNDALMSLRGDINGKSLRRMSNGLGIDSDAVMDQMDSPEIEAMIASNRALAQRLKINGTPSFVFVDQMLRGYVPLKDMQNIVAQLRKDG
ncbi:MAG: protein-disulfide isomerase [Paracoccaceae bacterium]|jgi:protein-disulfide isomerase